VADTKPRGTVVPVIASTDQVVEIHWRRSDGTVVIERRTAPTEGK
jgi:hypothetical protein